MKSKKKKSLRQQRLELYQKEAKERGLAPVPVTIFREKRLRVKKKSDFSGEILEVAGTKEIILRRVIYVDAKWRERKFTSKIKLRPVFVFGKVREDRPGEYYLEEWRSQAQKRNALMNNVEDYRFQLRYRKHKMTYEEAQAKVKKSIRKRYQKDRKVTFDKTVDGALVVVYPYSTRRHR